MYHPLQMESREWFLETKIYDLSSEIYGQRMNIQRVTLEVIKFYGHTSLACKGSVLRIMYRLREKRPV